MLPKLSKRVRGYVCWILLALLVNLTGAVAFAADGWKSFDRVPTGIEDPDGLKWWFAPDSVRHDLGWWDVDQLGATDQMADYYMRWDSDVTFWFNNQPDRNYVHEQTTGYETYEWSGWYWTDLPTPDLAESSWEGEELADGYDETELGWDYPAQQIPAAQDRAVYLGWYSLRDDWTFVNSQSELCRPWELDDWYPEVWDDLGYIRIEGAG